MRAEGGEKAPGCVQELQLLQRAHGISVEVAAAAESGQPEVDH